MLKEKIRKFLTGISISKEYPCIDYRLLKDEVNVTMFYKGADIDITSNHLFLGYKPLIVGIYFTSDIELSEIRISFFHRRGEKLADVHLKRSVSKKLGDHYLVLFTGVHAKVFFLPYFNRSVNSVLRRFRRKMPGNVEMVGNEYQQVQAMYSVPRKVSVISLGEEGLYNMFPTDLHGNAGESFYVDSLRKTGKACSQLLSAKKIVKADVSLSVKDAVFAMGKNHMRELQALAAFDVDGHSALFGLPLPVGAIAYKELELFDHVGIGIHRVLIFDVRNDVIKSNDEPILACTNGSYLQWRINRSLPANFI